jgi:hypothetical protein
VRRSGAGDPPGREPFGAVPTTERGGGEEANFIRKA